MLPIVDATLPVRAREIIGQIALPGLATMGLRFFLLFMFLPISILVGVALFTIAGVIGFNFGFDLLAVICIKIMLYFFTFLRIFFAPPSLFSCAALGTNTE